MLGASADCGRVGVVFRHPDRPAPRALARGISFSIRHNNHVMQIVANPGSTAFDARHGDL